MYVSRFELLTAASRLHVAKHTLVTAEEEILHQKARYLNRVLLAILDGNIAGLDETESPFE